MSLFGLITGYNRLAGQNIQYRSRNDNYPDLCDFDRRLSEVSQKDGLPRPLVVASGMARLFTGFAGVALGAGAGAYFSDTQILPVLAGAFGGAVAGLQLNSSFVLAKVNYLRETGVDEDGSNQASRIGLNM